MTTADMHDLISGINRSESVKRGSYLIFDCHHIL